MKEFNKIKTFKDFINETKTMSLYEMSLHIEDNIGVDLFDFALGDIIDFDSMVGSVADDNGDNIIEFKVLTPKNKIKYYIENYTNKKVSKDLIEDVDIKVKEI